MHESYAVAAAVEAEETVQKAKIDTSSLPSCPLAFAYATKASPRMLYIDTRKTAPPSHLYYSAAKYYLIA